MSISETSLVKPFSKLSLPSICLLTPNKSVKHKIRLELEKSFSVVARQHYLADCVSLLNYGSYSLAGPFLGSPAAAVVTELLIASGVSSLLLVGFAGGLRSERAGIRIGDIIFPRGILSEEETSKLYGAKETEDSCGCKLQKDLEVHVNDSIDLSGQQISAHTGFIWSTDAPFLESAQKVERYAKKGAIAVEMEHAALARLAALNNVSLATVFIVSDLFKPNDSEKYSWTAGFGSKQVTSSLLLLTDSLQKLLSVEFENQGN